MVGPSLPAHDAMCFVMHGKWEIHIVLPRISVGYRIRSVLSALCSTLTLSGMRSHLVIYYSAL